MGTTYSVVAVDPSGKIKEADLRQEIEAALTTVNTQMSNWDAASEVSRFNASASRDAQAISPEFAAVMGAARDVHRLSDGQFDVTLGPLIDLWGFGAATPAKRMPGDAQIDAVMAAVGLDRTLTITNAALQKSNPGTQVYLSAIGKGFGVDHVARTIAAMGIKDYMVEIGGDLYTAGVNPDGLPWQIGIESPDHRARSVFDVADVSGLGMATSGDYRNYFERDGVRFSHILDSQTGRPVTHKTASATVLTENAMLADAWATAMLVLGRDRGMEIAEAQNLAVLFIERDGTRDHMAFKETRSSQFQRLQA